MCRKYFFKNKGCLSRKFIASGLSAVFSAGMFSSYAGAMEQELSEDNILESMLSDVENNKRDFFDFCEKEVEIPQGDAFLKFMGLTQEGIDSFNNNNNNNKDNALKIPTKKQILSKFIEKKFGDIFNIEGAKSLLIKMKSDEKKFKKIIKQIVYENFEIGTVIKNMESQILINEQGNMNPQIKSNEEVVNEQKNMKPKIVVGLIVVGLTVVGLSVYFSKRGSSKQPETEQPTNPDKPGTNPDKPEPEPDPASESDNTEDVQDSLGTELLKGLGTAVVGGTLAGSGAYAVNEVLRNKESKKVQSKDVNNGEKDGYIYVASVGNELVEENGNKDNGDDSKKGSRSNEIEEEKLEAEVEDGTESDELEENTKEEDESQ